MTHVFVPPELLTGLIRGHVHEAVIGHVHFLYIGANIYRMYMYFTADIRIDTAATCDEANAVTIDGEFQVYGTGDAPGTSCMFTFTAEDVTTDCPAVVCYMFDRYALFNSSKARLAVEGGTDTAVRTHFSYRTSEKGHS